MTWPNHVIRKDSRSHTKTALHWTPDGKRKRGRPKTTWRRTVEAELKEMNQTWGTIERMAKDCHQWRAFVAALHASRHSVLNKNSEKLNCIIVNFTTPLHEYFLYMKQWPAVFWSFPQPLHLGKCLRQTCCLTELQTQPLDPAPVPLPFWQDSQSLCSSHLWEHTVWLVQTFPSTFFVHRHGELKLVSTIWMLFSPTKKWNKIWNKSNTSKIWE